MLTVCTTFPNQAWDVYARASLVSLSRYWPGDVHLVVYLDDDALAADCEKVLDARTKAEVRIGKSAAHDRFLRRNQWGEHADFRYAACRFSHKVAALKAASELIAVDGDHHLLWLDADVITTAPVTHDWLAQFLPHGDAHVSYLGRSQFQYSECGFVGYRMSETGREFLNAFWAMYESEALFRLAQWHDSFVFDHVRKQYDQALFKNIAEGKSGIHVWLNTRLAERLEHWKGVQAKQLKRPITDAEASALARKARATVKS